MKKNLRAAHWDIMSRVRAGEGITDDELGVIRQYAKGSGSPTALADFAIAKTAVIADTQPEQRKQDPKQGDEPAEVESDVIAQKKAQLEALAQKARRSGRTEDRVAYVNAKQKLADAEVDEHNRSVLMRLVDEMRADGKSDANIAAFLNDKLD
jgi:hypothetical protein